MLGSVLRVLVSCKSPSSKTVNPDDEDLNPGTSGCRV